MHLAIMYKTIGAIGFEPTATRSQSECSTKLSYAPLTMHLSECLLWGITPNILTVYTGVRHNFRCEYPKGVYPISGTLVGTSQVLCDLIITLRVSGVNTHILKIIHPPLWVFLFPVRNRQTPFYGVILI